jgi:two-component system chemotaxis sensor kinase CheA
VTAAKDPLRFFRLEGREISEELGRTVLALEKSPAPGQVARLLRLAHTLKGAASVVRQRAIAAETHALEDVLVPLREREAEVTAADIARVLAHTDAIARHVAALGDGAGPQAQTPQDFAVTADESAELLDMLAETGLLIRGARHTLTLPENAGPVGSRLGSQLAERLERAERELREAHEAAERLRLSPCSAVLAPVERAMRDSAAALGKDVAVAMRGGEARLDAKVLAEAQRALLQLARNAVAHGIETPAERRLAGKPAQGRVEIVIARRGSLVSFTCRDDGRGIDLEAVRRAAREAGRPDAETKDLVGLLFRGGVSTSDAVTDLSGRGVGLDIVRDTAQRLGGEVGARTRPGRGTEITLIVPASLAALDVLLVEAGGAVCAVPLEAVQGSRHLAPGEVLRTPEGERVALGGETVPFARLARILGRARTGAGATLAFVLQQGSARAVIGVERLLGVANIVVRPLPQAASADAVIAGASPDAEGVPRLVLEPQALLAAALAARVEEQAAGAGSQPPILVIDDSLTTRALEQSILESAGYEVDLATSAEEGLLKARKRRYGLFLVDVEMPGMDGYGFIRAIRADPGLCATPAILVTSLNGAEDRRRGVEAGAQAYVVKSEFNQVHVLQTIRQCLVPA